MPQPFYLSLPLILYIAFSVNIYQQLEIELGDTVAKDLVKDNFGATTAETKVYIHIFIV
jgi:hypothetical protein